MLHRAGHLAFTATRLHRHPPSRLFIYNLKLSVLPAPFMRVSRKNIYVFWGMTSPILVYSYRNFGWYSAFMFSTVLMTETCSSVTPVQISRNTRRRIPDDAFLHSLLLRGSNPTNCRYY
jgi:hypothetical protein